MDRRNCTCVLVFNFKESLLKAQADLSGCGDREQLQEMWLGSPSNSWQSCIVEMHGVNRVFVKVRINVALTLGLALLPSLFKAPRKLRSDPVWLCMSSRQLINNGTLGVCSRTDSIMETKGWKGLPILSSSGNHIL